MKEKTLKNKLNNISQISISWVDNNHTTQCNYIIIALCSDGTLWEKKEGRETWECIN